MKVDINNPAHRKMAVDMLKNYCEKCGQDPQAVLSNVAGIPAIVEKIYNEQSWVVRKMLSVKELTEAVVNNVDELKKLV